MKQKISVSIDEETLQKIEQLTQQSNFRNRSHVIEFAVKKLEEERK